MSVLDDEFVAWLIDAADDDLVDMDDTTSTNTSTTTSNTSKPTSKTTIRIATRRTQTPLLTLDAPRTSARTVAFISSNGASLLCFAARGECAVRVISLADARLVAVIALADAVTRLVAAPPAECALGASVFPARIFAPFSASLLVGTRGGHVLALSVSVDGPVHRHIVDADQIADVNALASDEVLCVDLGVANAAAAAFPVECRGAGRRVTCIEVWSAVHCVVVGYACGALLVVSLIDRSLVFSLLTSGEALHLPVSHAAFQALAEDSSAFVWISSSNASSADAPVVFSLYQLKYDSSGEAERPTLLRALAAADDVDDANGEYVRDYLVPPPRGIALHHQRAVCLEGRALSCTALAAARERSLRYALFAWQSGDETHVELFDVFVLVHGSTRDNTRLFAPLDIHSSDGEHLTALHVPLDSILTPPLGQQARISAQALRRGDIVLDDHRAQLPLSFTVVALFETTQQTVHLVDAQRAAIEALRAAGAGALQTPASAYRQLCTAGLIDQDGGSDDADGSAAPSRRRAILTMALECGEAAFVCDTVLELRAALALDVETVLGSRYALGNPAFVLDWAVHIVAVLQRRVALALGTTEHSLADINDAGSLAIVNANGAKRRHWCTRAYSWLGDVHDILGALLAREDEFGTTESGIERIEAVREQVRRVAQQLEFGAWLADVGLRNDADATSDDELAIDDTDNDPASVPLQQRQQRTLAQLEIVVAERRAKRATAHSAGAVRVDGERMTASSDVQQEVPLLIDLWCAQVSGSAATAVLYPFPTVGTLLSLFGTSVADSSSVATKQRIALYFLIDAEQSGPLLGAAAAGQDESLASVYARDFGLSVEEMRLVHGAWLLDSGNWSSALAYFCQSAPSDPLFGAQVRAAAIDSVPSPAALLLLARASAASLDAAGEREARVRVLLDAGLLDEALDVTRAAPADQRAPLLWRVFQRCAAHDSKALLHLPLSAEEDDYFARFAHSAVGRPVPQRAARPDADDFDATCRPLELLLAYSLARGRVLDAFTANRALQAADRTPLASTDLAERRAVRAELRNALLENYLLTLPKAQREHVERASAATEATVQQQQQQQTRTTTTQALPSVPPSVQRAAARRARPQSPSHEAAGTSESVLNRFLAPPSTTTAPRSRSVTAALTHASSIPDTSQRRLDFSDTSAVAAESLLERAPAVPFDRPVTPPPRAQQQRAPALLASPSTRIVPGSPAAKKSAMRAKNRTPSHLREQIDVDIDDLVPPNDNTSPLPSELQAGSHRDEMDAYFAQFDKRSTSARISSSVDLASLAGVVPQPRSSATPVALPSAPKTPIAKSKPKPVDAIAVDASPSSSTPVTLTSRKYALRRRAQK